MENEKVKVTLKDWMITGVVLLAIILLLSTCSSGGDSGGKCKYCRQETNWSYTIDGWVCYSCSH